MKNRIATYLLHVRLSHQLLFVSTLLSAHFSFGQSLLHDWSVGIGGTGSTNSERILTDNNGDQLITGTYSGTVDFDPGPGTNTLTTPNFETYFLKLDAQGNFLWVVSYEFSSVSGACHVGFDAANNIYITGAFENTVDFDLGTGVFNLTSNGSNDAFVLKLDSNGNFIHAISFGGISPDLPSSLIVDENGNVYVSGRFANTVDFDPSTSTANFTSAGSWDGFILKYTSDLTFGWMRHIAGTDNNGEDTEITYDNGFIYAAGVFRGTADIDGTLGVQNATSSGDRDIYITKFDTSGAFIWAQHFGGPNADSPSGLACDESGNVLLTGLFRGTVDFDPGPGTNIQTGSTTSQDCFVLKLSPSSAFQWARIFGGTGTDFTFSLSVDSENNVAVSGWFQNTVDFDPGASTFNITSGGGSDGFLEILDSSGLFVNVYQITGMSTVQVRSHSINTNGDYYLTGPFSGSIDSDPGTSTNSLTASGAASLYVTKLANCNESSTDVISACDTYTWIDGNTYTSSNTTAQFLGQNQLGCDSLVFLDLTINSSTQFTDVLSDCGPIVWLDGNTYSQSTSGPTFVLTNNVGCDSTITLNFTLLSNSGTDVQTACDSLTWIDGNTYFSDNSTATFTLVNSNGCDSIVTLDLTITTNDVGISQSGGNLLSNQSNATYQWIDCDNGFSNITGATGISFTPSVNGNYAVILTQNGCTDTSDCFLVDFVGLEETLQSTIQVFPNPTSGAVFISTNDGSSDLLIHVQDMTGKIIEEKYYYSGQASFDLPVEKGVYLLTVVSGNTETAKFAVVKN